MAPPPPLPRPPPPSLLFLFLLLLHFLSLLPAAVHAAAHVGLDDLIGLYTLHPDSHLLASNASCPLSLSVDTFNFRVTNAPSRVASPSAFNIVIPHVVTHADGVRCDKGSNIYAVTSGHPFVTDPSAAVNAWAGAGNSTFYNRWLPRTHSDYDAFISAIVSHPWIIGYDFSQRTCAAFILPAHAAYLWVQFSSPVTLGPLTLSPRLKLLLLGFGGEHREEACVFVAQRVGGQSPYGNGPVADTTENLTHSTRPWPSYNTFMSLPPGVSVPPGYDTPSPTPSPSSSPSNSQTPTPSASFAFVPPPAQGPAPSNGQQDGDEDVFVENDPDGPLGPAASASAAACFPASARVLLADRVTTVAMSDLVLGQHVHTPSTRMKSSSSSSSSPILLFSHRVPAHTSSSSTSKLQLFPFVNITFARTRGGGITSSLILSADHYIHIRVKDKPLMMPAKLVKPYAHKVVLVDGSVQRVTAVGRTIMSGLYAPHTTQGDIVVDGVVVSTFTCAVHPWLAHHVLLAPLRVLHALGFQRGVAVVGQWLQPWLDDGGPETIRRLLPGGPVTLDRFT